MCTRQVRLCAVYTGLGALQRSAECLSLLLGHSISRVYNTVAVPCLVDEVKGRCTVCPITPISAVRAVQ